MKTITCPYCQTELVGDFRSGDTIKCNSCKGRFQPPPNFLKEYSGSCVVCPYCKTSIDNDVWPGTFVQCPVCKGRFQTEENNNIEISRPAGIKAGVGFFTALTLFGALFFVGMFTGGRIRQHPVLMDTAVRSCVGSLPAFVFSVFVAWKVFKGRNWARWVLDIGLSAAIALALLRAGSQTAIYRYSFDVQASELETLCWIDFGVKLLLGIGTLCCLNSRKSRAWLRLPKNNKRSRDFPWWCFLLFIVVLCPALLLLAMNNMAKEECYLSQKSNPDKTWSKVRQTEPIQKAGDRLVLHVGSELIPFRWCPPGSFMMGSPVSEKGRDADEEEQHHVTLSKGFWIGETEVTQGLWEAVMGDNPSDSPMGAVYPVNSVSWNNCQEFIAKLNALKLANWEFSLPTEAQWEYACRAGSIGAYSGNGNLNEMGWFEGNANWEPKQVACKASNAWGIHDMHGNIKEWCADWYRPYTNESTVDPIGPQSGDGRILRGGDCASSPRACRSASRHPNDPWVRGSRYGLRLCANRISN